MGQLFVRGCVLPCSSDMNEYKRTSQINKSSYKETKSHIMVEFSVKGSLILSALPLFHFVPHSKNMMSAWQCWTAPIWMCVCVCLVLDWYPNPGVYSHTTLRVLEIHCNTDHDKVVTQFGVLKPLSLLMTYLYSFVLAILASVLCAMHPRCWHVPLKWRIKLYLIISCHVMLWGIAVCPKNRKKKPWDYFVKLNNAVLSHPWMGTRCLKQRPCCVRSLAPQGYTVPAHRKVFLCWEPVQNGRHSLSPGRLLSSQTARANCCHKERLHRWMPCWSRWMIYTRSGRAMPPNLINQGFWRRK